MATPSPKDRRTWTVEDDREDSRLKQRDADRSTWQRLGRSLGFRGRELEKLLSRFFDDRIAAALRTHQSNLAEQLKNPATADAVRGPLVDILFDDITELVTFLTSKDANVNKRTKKPR